MKKLMIALSAAAMAFGLRAAGGFIGGSNFESDTAGTIQAGSIAADGGSWSTTDEGATLTVATEGVASGVSRPAKWEKDDNYQYLNDKTAFGKPLDFALATAQEIGEGVYFDSLVKFTACDETPTFSDANAKLAVWLQENADGTATNLYVRAGKFVGGVAQAENYVCTTCPGEGWHRLTIKSIATIYAGLTGASAAPGFVVYVDGEALETAVSTD